MCWKRNFTLGIHNQIYIVHYSQIGKLNICNDVHPPPPQKKKQLYTNHVHRSRHPTMSVKKHWELKFMVDNSNESKPMN